VAGSKLHCMVGCDWLVQLVVSDSVTKSCDKMPWYFLNQLIHRCRSPFDWGPSYL
jgi:hypothetical protein